MSTSARSFYEAQFRESAYARLDDARGDAPALARFVEDRGLREQARVLEVGCGRGAFQHLADGWVGVDIAETAGSGVGKPFVVASAVALPFPPV